MMRLSSISSSTTGALLFLLLITSNTSCHGWSSMSIINNIPSSVRLNKNNQPRLCSVVGGIVTTIARVGLCLPHSTEQLRVEVSAKSNRDLLRGKVQKLSIDVQKSKSIFLKVNEFYVDGTNLDFGWYPLLLTTIPTALVLSRSIFFTIKALMTCFYLNSLRGYIKAARDKNKNNELLVPGSNINTNNSPSSSSSLSSWFEPVRKVLGGKAPCRLNYGIVLTDDNIATSSLLKFVFRIILQYIMKNSVLKVAATAGDTAQTMVNKNNQIGQQYTTNKEEDSSKLTRLLSATSFELSGPLRFTPDGHLMIPSKAVIPPNNNEQQINQNNNSKSYLDFILRTKIQGGNYNDWTMMNNPNNPKQEGALLQFVDPECRFDVSAVTPLPGVLSKFLPTVLWLPIGGGVGIPFGGKLNRIQRVDITDGECQLKGEISFFEKNKKEYGLSFSN